MRVCDDDHDARARYLLMTRMRQRLGLSLAPVAGVEAGQHGSPVAPSDRRRTSGDRWSASTRP